MTGGTGLVLRQGHEVVQGHSRRFEYHSDGASLLANRITASAPDHGFIRGVHTDMILKRPGSSDLCVPARSVFAESDSDSGSESSCDEMESNSPLCGRT